MFWIAVSSTINLSGNPHGGYGYSGYNSGNWAGVAAGENGTLDAGGGFPQSVISPIAQPLFVLPSTPQGMAAVPSFYYMGKVVIFQEIRHTSNLKLKYYAYAQRTPNSDAMS